MSVATRGPSAMRRVASFKTLGTTAVLVVERARVLGAALAILHEQVDAIDRACSRFRPDSEIWSLYFQSGRAVRVSALLYDAVAAALDVAQRTGGAVDPTVGRAVESLGYDRDYEELPTDGSALEDTAAPAPGWRQVELDPSRRSLRVPNGVRLDLGATAKALVADRAAVVIADATATGVLVSIGGDIAVAGEAPAEGWPVGIAVDSSNPAAVEQVVSIAGGGLASSSPLVRSWRRGSRRLHHIVDPATGDVASTHWRLVSVAARTCLEANALSTAGVVWGESAIERLAAVALPARLCRHDGAVTTLGGWPAMDGPSPAPGAG